MKPIITIQSESLGYGNVRLHNTGGIGIYPGVTVAVGANGSGKTTLGTVLAKGRHAYGNRLEFSHGLTVKMLSFTDIHSLSGLEVQYFAQRMESTMNDLVPTVADILGPKADSPQWQSLSRRFGFTDSLHKKVNFLSSGELRKLLVINALAERPGLLVLDNPYIGLDAGSRRELDAMLCGLPAQGTSVLMLLCDAADIPAYADRVMNIEGCRVSQPQPVTGFTPVQTGERNPVTLPDRPGKGVDCRTAFAIRGGHARYGDTVIFEGLDWTVSQGERWVLKGHNGSGKSLLLSMVCADNPQGYANDITLFDRRRGSGESIWEIKDNIGYVSPEMQLFFKSASSVTEIIAQGMRNALNRYRPLDDTERETVRQWMCLLGIEELATRKFDTLSSGQQRLVLLARAMIRQPELLVLDEPLHGLDGRNKALVKDVIDRTVQRNGTTLIFVTHYDSEIPSCIDRCFTMPGRK